MHRSRDRFLTLGLPFLAIVLGACASVVPASLREQARPVSFKELQRAPETYAGTLLLLGGEIVAVRARGEWIEVELFERPLGLRDRPRLDRPPRGRFVVLFPPQEGDERMDRLEPGRLVTVVGEAQGRTRLSPDAPSDGLPLLMARYIHLWPAPLFPGGPGIGIEFGVQGSIAF